MGKELIVMTSTLPRWKNDSEASFVLEFAKYIKPYFKDVVILAPHVKGAEYNEVLDGVHIERFKYFREKLCYDEGMFFKKKKFLNKLSIPSFVYNTYRKLRETTTAFEWPYLNTAVVFAWYFPQGLAAYINKLLHKHDYYIMLPGTDVYGGKGFISKFLFKKVLKNAKQIFVLSTAVQKHLVEKYGFNSVVMPLGVPKKLVKKISNRKRGHKILCLGRLVIQKGFQYAIRAVNDLVEKDDKYCDVRLTIAGSGDYLNDLKNLAASHIDFIGAVPHSKVYELFRKHDLFLFPSLSGKNGTESFGLVAVEAMMNGIPIIASDVGGIPDIVIHNKTGGLVPEADIDALEQSIEYVFNNPKKIDKIRKQAVQHVLKNFTWEAICKKYMRYLK